MAAEPAQSSIDGVLVASNRGPVSFGRGPDGAVRAERGAGGLVSALEGALSGFGGLWVASAMSAEDRAFATGKPFRVEPEPGRGELTLRYLAFDSTEYDRFYNGISNRILWFLHHRLWNPPYTPSFDADIGRSWNAYRQVNRAFARALAEDGAAHHDPAFLVQDYHLTLVPEMLRTLRPDARINHFSHIPFAGPTDLRILPDRYRIEMLQGLLGADVVGFHAPDWAEGFLLCCRDLPGARVDLRRRIVRWQGRRVRIRVYPIQIDQGALKAEARQGRVAEIRRRLASRGADRLILRVDRLELSKNIVRGFQAYGEMLRRHREWRGRVRFLAMLNPSRERVPEYRGYAIACRVAAGEVNARFGTPRWRPIDLVVRDDMPMTLAAYGIYDVLMVNPLFDGMNLVAKEGPVINQRSGVLILSENAGAWNELGRYALGVNPFDTSATAEALHRALVMGQQERRGRARGLRTAISRRTPARWVNEQLADLAHRS